MKSRFAMGCCCGPVGGSGTDLAHIPDCFCPDIPSPLTMTSCDPACNFHMFQPCTLEWQPTPAWAAPLLLGPNIFLSTESFPDPLAGDSLFYHYLTCSLNQIVLTRLYPESPYGSPYRDGILYQWIISENVCSPFGMNAGKAFPGSDPTCCCTLRAGGGAPGCVNTTPGGVGC